MRARMGAWGARIAGLLVGLMCAACGSQGHGATKPTTCDGSEALCSARLNQIFVAGTHNSFAASDEPGWHFANQTYGIPRQLRDGIRALLIDVHYGVRDPSSGRVRTDFEAEGADRNKVVEQVPAAALKVADRIAGGIGLGHGQGTPELYLCHTLCELGAEPLARELEAVRDFLAGHRDQVLVVVVEDYVPPAAIESAFKQAGLLRYVATIKQHAPLPTLGQLVGEDRRLVVFAEEKGGTPAWYMPAFSYMQDTPLGALHPGQLSCRRYRGEEGSPLLLLNYWIPPFPPSPTINAQIGRAAFLRTWVERCARQRAVTGAIVAVDFYQRTSVVNVVRQLNERR